MLCYCCGKPQLGTKKVREKRVLGKLIQVDDNLRAEKQLDLTYRRIKLVFWATVSVSAMLVAALWSVVDHGTLLTWLLSQAVVMAVRVVLLRRHHKKNIHAVHWKWKTEYAIGSAIAGLNWGITLFIFHLGLHEPTTLFLILVIFALGAYGSVSMASVLSSAVAFLLPLLLSLAVWLFPRDHFLGTSAVIYLGLMLMMARQVHKVILAAHLTTVENEAQKIALQESGKRMVNYFENAPGFFFTLLRKPDGHISMPFASTGITALFGLKPEELAESVTALAALYNAEDREKVFAEMNRSGQSLTPCRVTFRANHPEKGEIWVEARSVPQQDQEGNIRWNGFMQDITEQKQAEALLQKREREFRALAENAPDPIYRYDRNCRRVYINKAVEQMTGVPLSKILGKSPTEAIPNPSVDAVKAEQTIRRVLDTGMPGELEVSFVAADGRDTTVHNLLVPEFAEDGSVESVLCIGRDVTAHKYMTDVLTKSERNFRALAENATDNIARHDRQCRITYLNPNLEVTLGLSSGFLLNKSLTEVFSDGLFDDYEGTLKQVIASGKTAEHSLMLPDTGEGERYHHIRLTPEKNDNGEVGGVLAIGRDITELKRYEQSLLARAELEQRQSEFFAIAPGMFATVEHRADGSYTMPFVSEGIHELFGLDSEAVMRDFGVLVARIHPDEIGVTFSKTEESERDLSPYHVEFRIIHPTRGVRWIECRSLPKRLPDGGTRWDGFYHDITERKLAEQQLKDALEFSEGIINAMPDLLFEVDRNGRYLNFWTQNPDVQDAQKTALLGKTFYEVLSPENAEAAMNAIREADKKGASYGKALCIVQPNGESRWYEHSLTKKVGSTPENITFLALSRDVTERELMEQALLRREEEFRTLAEHIPDVIIRYDRDCRRVYVNNPALLTMEGAPQDTLIGNSPATYTPLIDPESYLAELRKVMQSGAASMLEVAMRGAHGTTIWYTASFVPEFDSKGNVSGALMVARDISERKQLSDSLLESQTRYRQIFDNSQEGLYLFDVTEDERFRMVEVNPAFERLVGIPREAMVGKFHEEVLPGEMGEKVAAKYRRCLAAGTVYEEELELELPAGKLIYFSTLVPVRNEAGRIVRIVGITRDVTERKRMEDLLRQREEMFRTLVESAPDPIFRYDRELRRTYINPAVGRITGQPENMLRGETLESAPIAAKTENERLQQDIQRVLETGQPHEGEIEYTAPDGRYYYFLNRFGPEFNKNGEVVGVVSIMRNIAEQKLAQKALLQREQEFRALSENSPDTIMRYDLECRRIYVNPAFTKLIGMPAEALLGGTPTQYSSSPQAQAYEHALRRVLQSGEPGEHEYTWLASSGREIISHFRIIPERDADGKVASVLAIGRDITERKQAEATLQKNFQRLSELNLKLEENTRTLEEQAVELEASQEQFKLTEEWYRGILHSAPDGMLVIDGSGIIIKVNAQINAMFGYAEGELAGNSIEVLLPPDVRERHIGKRHAFAASGNSGRPMNGALNNLRGYRKDGSEFPVDVSLSRLPDTGGKTGTICAAIRDVTERRHMEDALRTERGLFVGGPTVVFKWKVQQGWPVQYVSPNVANQFGYTVEEFTSGKILYAAIVHPDDLARVTDEVSTFCAQGLNSYEQIYRIAHADGRYRWIYDFTVVGRSADGAVAQLHGYVMDITRQKLAEETLLAREQEFRTLIENAPDTIARYDRDCRRTYVNPLFAKMVGGGEAALLGKTPSECPGGPNADLYEAKIKEAFANGENTEFELHWPDTDGREICSHVRLTVERDAAGKAVSVLGVGRDITELNSHRKRIYRMAFYDTLTSLPNRALFNDRLNQMLTDASRHEQQAGVMLLDLDRFKAVNDTLGHAAGDELLRIAAGRLAYCVRGYDTVSRLSGDEFAILLPEVRSGDDLGRVARKILESFNEPFILEGKEVFVGCSIGIAVYPSDGETADNLLKQADSAMYFAKRSGRHTFRFYSSDLMDSANERLTLETDLRHGFVRGELELYYQPKVRLADGVVIGSEALLRWHHPERGMVPPDKYIPIAEDCGLIVEIGEWVLRNGCRTAGKWNGVGKPLHKVAINLSARQFMSGDLVKTVQQVLAETDCKPEWIELEITESLLLDEDGAVLDMLSAFREMGITIAIDDFGTGYSALSYLARFPIDTLKIDRSFTSRIHEEGHHTELVKAIISIAYSLNQAVVAEGVETAEEAAFLQAHGCHIAQGFLYSCAVPKKQFELLPLSFGQSEKIEAQ
jgi:diguanylate cyclase (GGDEF)-like protein/PAS domain S-box-containing protein